MLELPFSFRFKPSFILPRDAGRKEVGELNGAQRLNYLNDLNLKLFTGGKMTTLSKLLAFLGIAFIVCIALSKES